MRTILNSRVRTLALFVAALTSFGPSAAGQTYNKPVVFEGARIIDGTGRPPLENAALVLDGSVIRAVGKKGSLRYPKGAEVVDVGGKTFIPALINLHGHLGLTRGLEQSAENYTKQIVLAQLEKYLAYGVGTIVSLGSDQGLIYKLREVQRTESLSGARLYTAGRGFGVPGGYPPRLANAPDRFRPQTVDEARNQVRELAAQRPDFVKIWVDDDFGRVPKMRSEIFQTVINEAHQYGLRVVAHMFYLEDAKALVEAGIDGLAHSIRDQAVDQHLINAMKASGVFLVPTLVRDESTFIFATGPAWLDDPFFQAGLEAGVLETLHSPSFINRFRLNPNLEKLRAAFELGKDNLKTLFGAGVKIGLGSDSGPPARFQGFFEHRELQLMVEAGLTPMQAIVAATGTAAEILRAGSEFGTLEPGKKADFLVLDANPLEDIRNTQRLSAVWQAGKRVKHVAAR